MVELTIKRTDCGYFEFDGIWDNNPNLPDEYYNCHYCGVMINPIYSYIITKLIKADLVDESFARVCCDCYSLMKHIGFVRCQNCSSILTFGISSSDNNLIEFYCEECRKSFKRVLIEEL